jgi:two-component sensor histidine kinase/DNA-binding response OmpR family regulator
MTGNERVNILLVDDQPGKLLSYEAILLGLNENLLKASSGREALEHLLKSDVAVVLVDVCMPDLDGFQLAAMIRDHPRFQKTAIIFISAILLSEMDSLRGYEMGAVDYVPVPVVPEVLRAKVKVFAELYRKTRQLEQLNEELEARVAERTAALEASTTQLIQSEQRRSLALAAGNMGSWDLDVVTGHYHWDDGHYRIFGVDPRHFVVTPESVRLRVHSDDWHNLQTGFECLRENGCAHQLEFRVLRPDGQIRWCIGSAAATIDKDNRVTRVSGVTFDITERKEAEERQTLLAREVDHRAKNALALVQSILRLTRANDLPAYITAVEGRIKALSRAHTVLSQSRWHGAALRGLVDEELAPYRVGNVEKIKTTGPEVLLQPASAQTLALALHELATNAAKYGALSSVSGQLRLTWTFNDNKLVLDWNETGGPVTKVPGTSGFGTRIILASIERQLLGRASFDWRREGLRCLISVPLSNTRETIELLETRGSVETAAAGAGIVLTGGSVMLVEDEAIVALAVNDSLTDLGISVLGPFSRVSDACRALQDHQVDAAILDVNLDGEMVYSFAEMLTARRIPFVFATGYGAESIESRFEHIPVLQKPIEKDMLTRLFLRPCSEQASIVNESGRPA